MTTIKRPGYRPGNRPAFHIGEIYFYLVDGSSRPFLVVHTEGGRIGGWLFSAPPLDAHTGTMKQLVADPAKRLQPCYLTVDAAALTPR